jgi:hypothetical protein
MHGIIDFLTGDSIEAAQLREKYVFKLIPMLNPDGVVNGNNRCDISGLDLNRCWSDPSRDKHPTIFHAKELIKKVKAQRAVGLVLDLHGHSKLEGVFVYGNAPDRKHMHRAAQKNFIGKPSTGTWEESQPLSSMKDVFLWRLKLFPRYSAFLQTTPSYLTSYLIVSMLIEYWLRSHQCSLLSSAGAV